jgi:hypothetical protein
MAKTAAEGDRRMEWEVRGGVWENLHVFIFYTAVTFAVLATAGVARFVTGILCIPFLIYSIFTMYSSATYAIIDPESKELRIEKYYYLLPVKRTIGSEDITSLVVKESARPPADSEEQASKRDLSYYVRVYALLKNGKRVKLFRSGVTGAPLDNRKKAYLIATTIAATMNLPVEYSTARDRSAAKEMHLAGSSPG